MKVTVFDLETGRIDRVVSCAESDVSIQYDGAREAFIDGEYADDAYYVEGLTPVLIPPKPSPAHVFDFLVKGWLDPRTLLNHQDAQWALLKKARTAYVDAPLTTPYGVFDCAPASRSSITDAVIMLQTLAGMDQTPTIDFTLHDNTVVILGLTEMVTVGLLMGQRVQEAHSISREKRIAVYAATTQEAVEGITW